jgi:spermidine synthase
VAFSFQGTSTAVLIAATAVLGILVGAEVPLLMTLLQRGRTTGDGAGDGATGAGRLLADLNAADYAGAVVGGLVWPFLLLPLPGRSGARRSPAWSTWWRRPWWRRSCCAPG